MEQKIKLLGGHYVGQTEAWSWAPGTLLDGKV